VAVHAYNGSTNRERREKKKRMVAQPAEVGANFISFADSGNGGKDHQGLKCF
jgi:hypothetical protein